MEEAASGDRTHALAHALNFTFDLRVEAEVAEGTCVKLSAAAATPPAAEAADSLAGPSRHHHPASGPAGGSA